MPEPHLDGAPAHAADRKAMRRVRRARYSASAAAEAAPSAVAQSAVPAISAAAGEGTAPRRHSATMTMKSSASMPGCIRHQRARLAPLAPYIPAASARFRIPHMRPITGS